MPSKTDKIDIKAPLKKSQVTFKKNNPYANSGSQPVDQRKKFQQLMEQGNKTLQKLSEVNERFKTGVGQGSKKYADS